MQWLCNIGKSLNELLAMSYQSQEGLDFSVCSRWGEFSHSFQVLLSGPNGLLGYMMGQIVDFITEEFALTRLELQIMFSEAFKHDMQTLQVLFLSFGKDNHVIQVY